MAAPVFDPSKPYEVESGDVPQFDPSAPFELESGNLEQIPEDFRPRLAVRTARPPASPLPSRPPPPPSQPFDYRAVLDRMLLALPKGGQEIKRQVGSMLASPLAAPLIHTATAGLPVVPALMAAGSGVIKDATRQAGRRIATEARAESAKLADLGQAIGGGTAGDIAEMLVTTGVASLPVIPAAMLGGVPGAALVAGGQSFSSILDDATQAYVKQGDPLQLAEQKALIPASIGGIITGTLTRVIPGGTEFLARRIATGELSKAAGAGVVKQIIRNAWQEVPEETLDQASQGIVAKLTYDPNKTGEQIWKEAVIAGLAGGFLSATTGGTMVGISKIAQSADQAYRRFIERNANATPARQEERQQERARTYTQLQANGQDRVQSPIISPPGPAPGSRDLPPQVPPAIAPQTPAAPEIRPKSHADLLQRLNVQIQSISTLEDAKKMMEVVGLGYYSSLSYPERSELYRLIKQKETEVSDRSRGAIVPAPTPPVEVAPIGSALEQDPDVAQALAQIKIQLGVTNDEGMQFLAADSRDAQIELLEKFLKKRGIKTRPDYPEERGGTHIEAVEEAFGENLNVILENLPSLYDIASEKVRESLRGKAAPIIPAIGPRTEVIPTETEEEEKRRLQQVTPPPTAAAPSPQPPLVPSEAAPLEPTIRVRPNFFIRPRMDGVPDILDAIQELGGIRSMSSSEFPDKGEYDRFKETMSRGIARLLVRKNKGNRPDELVQMLADRDNIDQVFRITSTSDLWDAIEQASESRAKLRQKGNVEDKTTQFAQAALANIGKTPRQQGTQTVQLESLKVGDTFKIKGTLFTVVYVSPEDGSITVEDGQRFPRQELPASGQLYPDKGTFKDAQEAPASPELTATLAEIENQTKQYIEATLGGYPAADRDSARISIAEQAGRLARQYLSQRGSLKGFSINTIVRSRVANWIRDTKNQIRPISTETPIGDNQTLGDVVAQQPAGPAVNQQSVVQGFRATLTPEEQVVFDAGIDDPAALPMAPFLPRFKAYLDERGIGPQDVFGALAQSAGPRTAQPPSISVGIPQLRALVNSPEANLDPVIVSIINTMLDTPALQNLDWSKLTFQLGGGTSQFSGMADVTGWLIQMTRMPMASTFPHEIFHFLETLLPEADRATLDQIRREALLAEYPNAPQAVIDGNLTSHDFVEAGLPHIYYRYINNSEFLAHAGSENFTRSWWAKRNQTRWQALVQKIKDWLRGLLDALKRAGGLSPDLQQISRELLAGKYKNFPEAGTQAEQRHGSLAQALEQFPNIQAEDPSRAERAVKIGQAGEAVGQLPVVKDAIADLQTRANSQASNSRERFERDVARRVLADQTLRKSMAEPVANVLAAAQSVGTAVQTLADLKADPNTTPEELSAATGQAFDAIHNFLQRKASFDAKYATNRTALTDELSETYQQEATVMDQRDVATELFNDFVELGRLSLQTNADEEAKKAYTFATKNSTALRKILKWVANNVDLSGLRNGGITDVDGVFNLFTNTARPQFTPDRNRLEQIVGASEADIWAMARILLRSQPLQVRIEAAKSLAEGKQYAGPINETKTQLAQAIKKGNYDAALQLYTRGVVKAGIEQKEARDAVNFYLAKSRKLMVELKALDEVSQLLEQVRQDPEFRAQEAQTARALNARDVMFSNNGTTIRFKQVNEALPDVEVDLDNTVRSWETNQKRLHDLHEQYSDYVQNPNALGYNAQRANGMRSALPILEVLTSRLNDPRNSRLLPGLLTRTRTKVAQGLRLFGITTIPNFAFRYGAGPAFAYLKTADQAYSTVSEQARVQLEKHQQKRAIALIQAAKAHKLDPETYREMIWVPLVSTRQNFSDPVVLNKGDSIGNGHQILQEDLDYLTAWQAFERDLIDVFNNVGQNQFRTIKLLPQGIIFDDKGAFRLPFHHGPNTTSRFWPKDVQNWLATWKNAAPGGRVTFLNDHLSRFVLGYIRGIRQADWKFQYAFPSETYDVLQDMRTNPIESFDDLAQRIFDLRMANPDVPPMTLDEVSAELLKDFDRIFTAIERVTQKPEGEIRATMSDVDVVGGLSSFNTPRNRIYMPPGWYDYGGVTEADDVILEKKSEMPFALAYKNALETTQKALSRIVSDFAQRIKNMPQAKTEATTLMRRGELYYDQAEAIRMLNNVQAELANIENYLKAPSTVLLSDRPAETRHRGALGFAISSLLLAPKAMTTNLIGASMQSVLVRMEMERRGALSALISEARARIPGAISEIGFQLTRNKPAQTILRNSQNRFLIGKMAESIIDWVEAVQAHQQRQRELGLNYNYPLDVQMQAMRETASMGGRVTEAPPAELGGRLRNRATAFLRRQSKRMASAGVNFIDSRANGWGLQYAEQSEAMWKQMAQEFGPILEDAANAGGWKVNDWTDPRNRFPDAAVGGSRQLGGARKDPRKRAQRVREWFRNWAAIDIDKQMLDYYQRWNAAGRPEDMTLFSPEDFNQLAQSYAKDINLSAQDNRPSWARSASARQSLLLFMQYPIWAMQKFETIFDRMSDRKWTPDTVKSLPFMFQAAIIVAVMGLFATGVKRLLDRLFNKESPFPTIADAENPKEVGVAILSAMADMIPIYGGAINHQLNRGYSTGFDLNNQFVVLNLATDAIRTGRQVMETGGSLRPLQRFANRWVFPFNVVGQMAPNQEGLREVANTRNILASGTRATGLEGRLRKFQGGGDMTLTPGSPIVDDAVNAIGRNDMTGFREAFDRLVNYRKSLGDPKPEQSAIRAISARNPLRSIFGTKPTDFEMERIFKNLDSRRASEARSTLARFDSALAAVRPRTAARRSTRSRRTRVGGLALRRRGGGRRTTLRVRSPFRTRSRGSLRIRRPRRKRLTITA